MTVVNAKNVISMKVWIANTPDGERGLYSEEIDFLDEVTDLEQMDPSDKKISQQVLAYKINACKMFAGQEKKDNSLFKYFRTNGYKSNYTCPFKKGMNIHLYNMTNDDIFFPPIHIEVRGRFHKEVYGKLKGMKKWSKLFTQDAFFRVKK